MDDPEKRMEGNVGLSIELFHHKGLLVLLLLLLLVPLREAGYLY